MPDLDLRLVRYFTVVAGHQHIGRAAAELHVAQPSLSRQIQRLEEQLGVRLFDRNAHGSRLTPAGRVFLAQAKDLLGAARHAVTSVRAAATSGAITIGYTPGFTITPAVRDLRERYPAAEIHTRYLTWEDSRSLQEHRVDVVVSWQPFAFPIEGCRITVLYDDPRVLVVPLSHRLAGRASVTLADFADEPMVDFVIPGATAEWLAFWWPQRPDGGRLLAGPPVHTAQDKFELVASGRAIAMHPRGDQHILIRPDLTTIPIDGIAPCQAVMLTRPVDDNALVEEFRKSAQTCLPAQD
ncbi:LysR family transcriptional regulator [Actinoplanes sp. NBRC 14428]|uniref:DNA-binding transcriptional LysR family regulator n=1 Tax=Pseudosporangium ferrugineum TaxID=439699 RepID=A0A2T0RQE5_9ACTN|nr:LysR family transcriptional regulator [Pseudosporangium ferrugineum]PRY23381.1 DNA-binding transcriptional LysR family regulator [Pseudosporangium ferrugineum]BCJ55369.1 LysR family transcriptional regulator [Actinoplanes sp. NBRC 14428]